MKPDDLCIVDMDGKQVSGKRKRSSEILLHLAIIRRGPTSASCVHCHPPHATAFAVAHEPIPKCMLPEVEVFLGEVAIAKYETPGTQAFADTVLPYVKDTDTILLANHGTITYGADLEDAYFKTEIIDAYCRILLLAKQLGTVNYYSDDKAAELIKIKPGLGIPDPRLDLGPRELRPLRQQPLPRGLLRLQARAQGVHPRQVPESTGEPAAPAATALAARPRSPGGPDIDALVQTITDQVMHAMNGAPVERSQADDERGRRQGLRVGHLGRRLSRRAERPRCAGRIHPNARDARGPHESQHHRRRRTGRLVRGLRPAVRRRSSARST